MRRQRVLALDDGFTLVETMLTLVILSVGLTALAALQITAIKANASSKRLTAATLVAEAALEQLKDAPYANVQSASATTVTAGNMQFTRQVTVTANNPVANAKTVLVAVRWSEGSQTRTVPFTTIIYQP
jgi:prepilin-type N-terminal cleavage/methylation domain-containing protein